MGGRSCDPADAPTEGSGVLLRGAQGERGEPGRALGELASATSLCSLLSLCSHTHTFLQLIYRTGNGATYSAPPYHMRPAVLVRKTLRQVERAARLGAAERNLQYLRWHPAGRVAKLALNRCLSVLGLDPSAVHFIFRWVLEYAFLGTVIRKGSCTRVGCRCGCSEEQTRLAYLALPLARRLELAWDKEVAPVRRVRSGALAEGAARAEEGRSGGGKRRRRRTARVLVR